jgi:hypothetical protein
MTVSFKPPKISIRAGQLILGGMAALWALCLCIFPLHDTDFWWHLRTGDLIRQTGTIPRVDLFSSTHSGDLWIDLHWGFQVLVSWLYQQGGVTAIILTKAAVYTLSFAIALTASRSASVIGWQRSPGTGSPTTPASLEFALGCWLLPVVAMSGRALERPEMLSILFLATTLAILVRAEEFPRRLALLPPLFLIWVNCHALFVLGAMACLAWLFEMLLRWRLAPRWGLQPVSLQLRPTWVAGIATASIGGLFLNPWGYHGVFFPLTLYRKFSVDQDFYALRVGEFQTPWSFFQRFGFANVYFDAQLAVMALLLVALIVQTWRAGARPWQLLLAAAFLNLAWEASRNVSPFCIVAGFVLVQSLGAGPRGTTDAAEEEPLPANGVTQGELLLVLLLMLSGAGIVSGLWNDIAERNKPFEIREARAWFMHDAARFVAREGMPKLVYARNNGQASLVIYHAGPQRLVVFDPRLELMSRETFERFDAASEAMCRADPDWDRHIRNPSDPRPSVLLDSRTSRKEIEGLLNTPGWQLVFADGSGAVFVTTDIARELRLPVANIAPLMIPPET